MSCCCCSSTGGSATHKLTLRRRAQAFSGVLWQTSGSCTKPEMATLCGRASRAQRAMKTQSPETVVVEGFSRRERRTEGSQTVPPKDISGNACKTRRFDAKFTPQPQVCALRTRAIRSREWLQSAPEFREHRSFKGLDPAARADFRQGEHCSLRGHITHADALYSRTRSRRQW